ncbi:MAG: phosphatidylglycerol lysyltransferase [Treponema sp.]|jgi:phosphoglucomutase|nr:phosphatidylglycerol lysyltransferase [Treponema sp.]
MNSDTEKALEGMILSTSGWRGVFAESGGGESAETGISPSHRIIAAAAAQAFLEFPALRNRAAGGTGEIILGRDTRPTGEAVAAAMIPVILASGFGLRYISAAAAPEIAAYAGSRGSPFIYITASHNPIGHNGIKFGLGGGGVLPGAEAAALAEQFKELLASEERTGRLGEILASPPAAEEAYSLSARYKEEALKAYTLFTGETVSGRKGDEAGELLGVLSRGVRKLNLGIAADFNGSARTLSIDRDFLSNLGVKFYSINDKPGEIRHRIVPEGESLEPCRLFLEELRRKEAPAGPSVLLGYVPDCDGDRGNLVIWDEGEERARILEAQEVFALACAAELAYMVWIGDLKYDNTGNALVPAALAVNDPTSLRIDRIARAFDVSVFRAETGEANVAALAGKLRGQGYLVRILGEGSTGGSIIHPSAVRDPIDTAAAVLKLLAIRSEGGRRGLFDIWRGLSDQGGSCREDFTLSDIIASLPAFVTTGAYTEEAVMTVKTGDHGELKNRYEKIFLRDWEARKEELKARYGITGWDVSAYIGTEEKRGISRFGDAGRGGLKIGFTNAEGRKTACIWMRGSGTEPVFRVMADAEGSDRRFERDLIAWQRRMVLEADSL